VKPLANSWNRRNTHVYEGAVAHFVAGGPGYDIAYSSLDNFSKIGRLRRATAVLDPLVSAVDDIVEVSTPIILYASDFMRRTCTNSLPVSPAHCEKLLTLPMPVLQMGVVAVSW